MRSLNLTTAVYDLVNGPAPTTGQTSGLGSPAPFQPDYTVVILNATSGSLTYSMGPTSDKANPTVNGVSIAAGTAANVVLSNQFIWASGAGLVCLGN